MSEQESRTLPHSPESERAVLGAIMLDESLMSEAVRSLTPDDFYIRPNRVAYEAMLELYDTRSEINPIAVADVLRRKESLEQCGGLSGLMGLTTGLPRFSTIRQYVDSMKRTALRRQIIYLGAELEQRAIEGDQSEAEIVSWLDERVAKLSSVSDKKRGPEWVKDLIDPQLERFSRFHKGIIDAVPTGFPEIDHKLTGCGLSRQMGHILAASTSMGKTSMALDIAMNAVKAGYCVYVASIEMSKAILMDRVFAVEAKVERYRVSPGLSNIELNALFGAGERLAPLHLVIDDEVRSITHMRRSLREIERTRKVDLVVVDYLQLMESDERGSRNNQVGANSRQLQGLFKEFNVAGLVLAQLSREHEKQGREPELRDLRDSGEIEQDARSVFFLFGDKGEETQGYRPAFREITFKVAKQGEGALFRTIFPFDTGHTTFRPVE